MGPRESRSVHGIGLRLILHVRFCAYHFGYGSSRASVQIPHLSKLRVYELGYIIIVMRKPKPNITVYRRRLIRVNFLRPTRFELQLRIVQ